MFSRKATKPDLQIRAAHIEVAIGPGLTHGSMESLMAEVIDMHSMGLVSPELVGVIAALQNSSKNQHMQLARHPDS